MYERLNKFKAKHDTSHIQFLDCSRHRSFTKSSGTAFNSSIPLATWQQNKVTIEAVIRVIFYFLGYSWPLASPLWGQ